MSDKLSRKEIKRDEVLEGVARIVEWLRENGRTLLAVIAAVLVGIAAFALWQGIDERREREANRLLASALDSGDDLEATESALQNVIAEAGGTRAGSVAHAYLGTLAARRGADDAARDHWTQFLDEHSGHALAAQVERNLVALDRAGGRGDELVQSLRTRLASGASTLTADLLLWELARTLESLDRDAEALEIYERLETEHPNSVYAAQARQRTAALAAS